MTQHNTNTIFFCSICGYIKINHSCFRNGLDIQGIGGILTNSQDLYQYMWTTGSFQANHSRSQYFYQRSSQPYLVSIGLADLKKIFKISAMQSEP